MQMTRKEFFRASLAVAGGALGLSAGAGCGGGGGEESGGNCVDNGTSSTISANHGHTLTVSAADVAAGETKTYDIAGGAGHSHTVTISADRFASLAGGRTINVTSDNSNAHTHGVTVSCA